MNQPLWTPRTVTRPTIPWDPDTLIHEVRSILAEDDSIHVVTTPVDMATYSGPLALPEDRYLAIEPVWHAFHHAVKRHQVPYAAGDKSRRIPVFILAVTFPGDRTLHITRHLNKSGTAPMKSLYRTFVDGRLSPTADQVAQVPHHDFVSMIEATLEHDIRAYKPAATVSVTYVESEVSEWVTMSRGNAGASAIHGVMDAKHATRRKDKNP